jgi:hypothetical protein
MKDDTKKELRGLNARIAKALPQSDKELAKELSYLITRVDDETTKEHREIRRQVDSQRPIDEAEVDRRAKDLLPDYISQIQEAYKRQFEEAFTKRDSDLVKATEEVAKLKAQYEEERSNCGKFFKEWLYPKAESLLHCASVKSVAVGNVTLEEAWESAVTAIPLFIIDPNRSLLHINNLWIGCIEDKSAGVLIVVTMDDAQMKKCKRPTYLATAEEWIKEVNRIAKRLGRKDGQPRK